ncbi:hypothetical protein [Paracoccus sp. (in: a-proteobacteria)]|uniref:hypothetical protein n=1 Tax=Paracoccus sp. TaxID=267 RepID=UPI003A89CE40
MIFKSQLLRQNVETRGGTPTPPFSSTTPVSQVVAMCQKCKYSLEKPMLVAYGADSNTIYNQINATGLQYTTQDPVVKNLIGGDAPVMTFAEDATFSNHRKLPEGYFDPTDIGRNIGEIFSLDMSRSARILRLREWLSEALAGARLDTTGFAERYFNHMFGPVSAPRPLSKVEYHEDADLNRLAVNHIDVGVYCDRVLNAPGPKQTSNHRLHQALQIANWDINQIDVIDDLGVPAFKNYGFADKINLTNDMGNGLTLTVHGLQHVSAIVKKYCYNEDAKTYSLTLTCFLYDAFGIDSDDLVEFGAPKHAFIDLQDNDSFKESVLNDLSEFYRVHSSLAHAMNAWWLLQHSYGFAPLITRIVMEKDYEIYVG